MILGKPNSRLLFSTITAVDLVAAITLFNMGHTQFALLVIFFFCVFTPFLIWKKDVFIVQNAQILTDTIIDTRDYTHAEVLKSQYNFSDEEVKEYLDIINNVVAQDDNGKETNFRVLMKDLAAQIVPGPSINTSMIKKDKNGLSIQSLDTEGTSTGFSSEPKTHRKLGDLPNYDEDMNKFKK